MRLMVEARRAREVRATWALVLGRTYKRDDRGRFGSGGGGASDRLEDGTTAQRAMTDSLEQSSEAGKNRGPHGDEMMASIAAAQGFDGPPRAVSSEEFDRIAEETGATIYYRGIRPTDRKSAEEIHGQMLTGDYYAGAGIYGSGIHLAASRTTAEDYASQGGAAGAVSRFMIDPSAVAVDYQSARSQQRPYLERHRGSPEATAYADVGRFAAARSYDLVTTREGARKERLPVVLNRTVLIVDTQTFPASG